MNIQSNESKTHFAASEHRHLSIELILWTCNQNLRITFVVFLHFKDTQSNGSPAFAAGVDSIYKFFIRKLNR